MALCQLVQCCAVVGVLPCTDLPSGNINGTDCCLSVSLRTHPIVSQTVFDRKGLADLSDIRMASNVQTRYIKHGDWCAGALIKFILYYDK